MYMQFSFSELNLSFTPIIGVCCASFSSTHSLSLNCNRFLFSSKEGSVSFCTHGRTQTYPLCGFDLTILHAWHWHISSSFRMLVLSLVLLVGEKEVFGFFFFLPPNLNPLILHQNTLSSYTTSECPSPAFSFIQHPDFTRSFFFFLLLFLNPPFLYLFLDPLLIL